MVDGVGFASAPRPAAGVAGEAGHAAPSNFRSTTNFDAAPGAAVHDSATADFVADVAASAVGAAGAGPPRWPAHALERLVTTKIPVTRERYPLRRCRSLIAILWRETVWDSGAAADERRYSVDLSGNHEGGQRERSDCGRCHSPAGHCLPGRLLAAALPADRGAEPHRRA